MKGKIIFFIIVCFGLLNCHAYDDKYRPYQDERNTPYILPPEDLEIRPYCLMEYYWSFPIYVGFIDDEVYIRGLIRSYDILRTWWIKGTIKDNKIYIYPKDVIGKWNDPNTWQRFLGIFTYDVSHYQERDYTVYDYIIYKDPIELDFNPETKTFSGPKKRFLFNGNYEHLFGWPWGPEYPITSYAFNWKPTYAHPAYCKNFDFINARPMEDRCVVPKKPIVTTRYKYGEKGVYIEGDLVSTDGALMVTSNICYRIYTDDIPFESDYYFHGEWSEEAGKIILYPSFVTIDKPFDSLYVKVKYENLDGTWTESEPGYLDDSGIEVIGQENEVDGAVYDLMGRRVSRDNLAPGIYISNGQKFIVK